MSKAYLALPLFLSACASVPPPPAPVVVTSAPVPAAPRPLSAEPTDAELVANYTPIWLSLLAARNGASVEDARRSIPVSRFEVKRGNDGSASLRVTYTFKIDWATVQESDVIALRVGARDPSLPMVRHGKWLTQAELASVPEGPLTIQAKTLHPLPIGKHLQWASLDAAMSSVFEPGAQFRPRRVLATMIGGAGNDVFLEAQSQPLPGEPTKCLGVYVDLVTGTAKRDKRACG